MSSVARVLDDNGRVRAWRARWRDPAGVSKMKTFDRKVDADRFLAGLAADRLRGAYVDPTDRTTVGSFGGAWLDEQAQLKPSSMVRSRSIWANHVEPRWGTTSLAAVGHSAVSGWAAQLTAQGLAPSSVRKAVGMLSQILDAAMRDERIGRNACNGVPLPRLVRGEPRFLTMHQVQALAVACDGMAPLTRFLALTGVRFGEAAGLKVGRLDLMRRRARLAEQVTEIKGRQTWGTLKGHRARTVPIPAVLVDELAELVAGRRADETVFQAPEGGVVSLRNWRSRSFDPAVRALDLAPLTPHDLRHTAASLAIANRATPHAVQTMLGHASAAMTLDVYAGLFPDELGAVADRLDEAWRAAAVSAVGSVCDVAPVIPISRGSVGL